MFVKSCDFARRPLRGTALVATLVLGSMGLGAGPAAATTILSMTCAEIGANYAVPAASVQLNATLAAGETITVTKASGSGYYYNNQGSYVAHFTGSVTVSVTEANAGVWQFARSEPGGELTASCTSGDSAMGDVQTGLSSFVMTNQAAHLAGAVQRNVDGLFNGGAAPSVSSSGFFFQSSGLGQVLEGTGTLSSKSAETDWNVWGQGRYTRYEGDDNSFSGDQIDLVLGADYRLTEDTVLGGLLGFGKTDFDVGTDGGFDANGKTLGAYWAHRFGGLTADALLAHTWSEYDVASAGATGSFDAKRITLAASLRGQVQRPGVTLEPVVQLLYAIEDQDGYTDSLGGSVDATTIKAGRLSLGSRFLFDERVSGAGLYRPWLGLYADYHFSDADTTPASSLPALNDQLSARIAAGFSYVFANQGRLNLDLSIGGLGSGDYISYGLGLEYSIRF